MTPNNDIHQLILRTAAFRQAALRTVFGLALLLCVALQAAAQTTPTAFPTDTWATETPIKPVGTGSEDDPFIIALEENLLWLTLNVGNTNSGLKDGSNKGIGAGHESLYYKQTADLDLSAQEWIPIGGKTSNGFFGHYDGQGHTIKGVRIDWSAGVLAVKDKTSTTVERPSVCSSSSNFSFGFFGWFGGHLSNLVIDDACIYNGNSSSTTDQYDKKIGVLAGAVGTKVEDTADDKISIRNVVINNSLITDCGKNPWTKNYLVGGMIGDLNSGAYSNTALIDADIQIVNVVVDVDIELENSDISGANGHQYYVGGLVGRMRSPRWSHVPKNAIFTGSINAPRAIIGPIFAVARKSAGVGADKTGFAKMYTGLDGEFSTNLEYNGVSEPNKIPNSLYFFDYSVRGKEITDTDPAESSFKTYKARTLSQLSGSFTTTGEGKPDANEMKMFQGVNYGTYIKSAEAANTMASSFDIGNEFKLNITSSSKDVARVNAVELSKINKTDATTYSVTFTTNRDATDEYQIKWYVVSYTGLTTLLTGSTFDASTKSCSLSYSPKIDDFSLITVLYDGNQPLESTSKTFIENLRVKIINDEDALKASLIDRNGREHEATGTWQWFGYTGYITDDNSNRKTLIGQTTNTLALNEENNIYSSYYAEWTSEDNIITLANFWSKKNLVYVYNKEQTETFSADPSISFTTIIASYSDGNDSNLGRTPNTAVKTMARAYEILNPDFTAENNIVVVMGYQGDNVFLNKADVAKYARNATITGKSPDGTIAGGVLKMAGSDSYTKALNGTTVFENITFYGNRSNASDNNAELYIYCNFHDLTFSEGVKVMDYKTMKANETGLGDYTSTFITIIGGMDNFNEVNIPDYPTGNVIKGMTTITIKSGCWGRIIGSARNNGTNVQGISRNIFGKPNKPHRVQIVVDMIHEKDDDGKITDKDRYTIGQHYLYDIGLLVGGQTDGSVFVDAKLRMKNGTIGRFISGNISYGREADEFESDKITIKNKYASDGFYGSTELTLTGGEIAELVGGTLGRQENKVSADKTEKCNAYFYGRSILNIKGGIINNNVYGAGAGGVVGLGDDIKHTTDERIPYYSSGTTLAFGDYSNAKGKMPTMKYYVTDDNGEVVTDTDGNPITEDLDYANSYSIINISDKAVIKGNVFGGGYGYSKELDVTKALEQAGWMFGETTINMTGGTVEGNVYGGGAGASDYENDTSKPAGKDFTKLAVLYGNATINLTGGKIEGDVYGGAMGLAGFPNMATVYGNTYLTLDGAEVNGNIYGGCELSSIRHAVAGDDFGNTNVEIKSGIIGNNIFGGSKGDDAVAESVTEIDGDTWVHITGGDFINTPYINKVDKTDGFRSFNVYGGGNRKCIVKGTAHLDVRSGLMNIDDFVTKKADGTYDDKELKIFIPHEENPNSLEKYNTSKFQGPYMDLTYRRFSLYGGGYGEQTNCMNTDVYVKIPTDKNVPHGNTLDVPYDHQSFFDIAGGGYSGDIGYWVKKDGTRVAADAPAEDYDHYVGGECKVTIDGFTYARKIIGGGFYGSCRSTNTKIICGSLRQVYGGSLLGYVHDKALLEIGNRPQDMDDYEDPKVEGKSNTEKAKWLNDYIFFTENVYGGNDVKGIVGTKQWSWTDGAKKDGKLVYYYGQEGTDGGPLWQADVDKEETKGVVMNIYGGTFMGDVFGAGNGHYRGYYVPGWIRYDDGPARMYRTVRGINGKTYEEDLEAHPTEDPVSVIARHRVYRTRPMVGSVNINITGNGTDDMVKFQGNFYGGGSECSIGQWNTILPMEDPRRLAVGGHLHINIGGNVNFAQNLYMGTYGELYGEQHYQPAGIDLSTFDGSTTTELEKIGLAAYDHWYFNSTRNRYEPGFPAPGEADGNFGLLGEHMFRGYFKNIEMEGDVELTFYKNLYKADGTRKRWVPGEQAVTEYDAENITMGSFFLGGKCGYMTNNTYNVYCYNDHVGKHLRDVEAETVAGHVHEQWGSVYRITMPHGVTIKDKLVMGVEDAITNFYEYNEDFTSNAKSEPMYTFEGGIVTQTPYSFDHVVYNDIMTAENDGVWNPTITLPEDFYLDKPENTSYNDIKTWDEHTLRSGIYAGKKIYRRTYETYGLKNYMLRPNPAYTEGGTEPKFLTENNQERRYGLAVAHQDFIDSKPLVPFFGRRASRTANGDHQTVTKLTARCEFEPQKGTKEVTVDPDLSEELKEKEYHKLYGGIIYGGCYNSGVVIGDVILNVASNMLGKNVTPENQSEWFDHISGLGHYIGRVYGGGYGVDTRNDGDTYINLLRDVQAMNVFGGGMQGSVNGDTYINYIGTDKSYIYGAIYGGGFQGTVGKYYWRNNDYKTAATGTTLRSQAEYDRLSDTDKEGYHLYVAANGTNVTLISGNVDHVYGGSCMGNLYGATKVHLYDKVADETTLEHLDFSKYDDNFKTNWPEARLIVGTVYGGNDISGEIIHTDDTYQTLTNLYDTNVEMTETRDDSSTSSKTTPGARKGYNGFPLVGNLYGGSNGDYGSGQTTVTKDGKTYLGYAADSKIKYASGDENEVIEVNIGSNGKALPIPNVGRANIDIQGGTVVNLYGGGDMSTITDKTNIKVAYTLDETDSEGNITSYGNIEARAGFVDEDDIERVWNTCHVTSRQQMAEVMDYDARKFYYNIYRVFGGNNHADMAIQPSWELQSGHVGSVYSGANFGKMTYFQPAVAAQEAETDGDGNIVTPAKPAVKEKGLSLEIDSRNFHANAVYGGGRVGDVHPVVPTGTSTTNLYGTTLTIKDGVIDHVYGGNDVSGEVHYGSKVDIQGAISDDVYCAGNGNYVYQYGYPEGYTGDKTVIGEDYVITDETSRSGYRYFILPLKTGFAADDDVKKLEAINSYRPNVTRSNLTIGGENAANPAYVHGSIYMGGNSATVLTSAGENDYISFNIGSNVIINSIFMGSNGELLVDDDMIKHTNDRNGFNIGSSNAMLDTYMQAVDVEGLPKNFALDPNITNANIGNFFLGGNRGSMTTSKTIELEFPENITIFGKIVGGSNNANYEYGTTAKHVGGLKTPLQSYEENGETITPTDKVHLIVRSKFLPKHLKYPNGDWRRASLEDDIRDDKGVVVYRKYEGGVAKAYYKKEGDTYSEPYTGKTYLLPGTCNIYGGCYNSGVTVGNIKIDLYSDMLLFGSEWKGIAETGKSADDVLLALRTREQTVVNCVDGINEKVWHPFSVIGGGYGSGTSVYGNINVRLLPTITVADAVNGTPRKVSHPSCGNVFGGAQEGVVVGNTTVELRDGTVLANVYGASESSYMYGSTQILIGYPEHYECLVSGKYDLARADVYSKAYTDDQWKTNGNDGSEVVKRSVWYRKGDIVPKNVYEQILAAAKTEADRTALAEKFHHHNEDTPGELVEGATWDDIQVSVGDPSSRNARNATDIANTPYFGHGNVYGGGFEPTAANSALVGQKTLLRFKENYKPIDTSDISVGGITNYGGNSSIMIWDNPENAEMKTDGTGYKYTIGSTAEGGSGSIIKDHVSIGSGQFIKVDLNEGDNKMGLFYYDTSTGNFVHQPSGKYQAYEKDADGNDTTTPKDKGKTFYEIASDGGIYGGGRKVYFDGFSACDLAYYGYADFTPQMAKLINTFQRFDLLSLTDCCLQLQAAQDHASTSTDAGEKYSITRVGELHMNSSLAGKNLKLNPGVEDIENIGNTNHNAKRSRNFLGFYRSVKFLGALVSNVEFEETQHKHHGKDGLVGSDSYFTNKQTIVNTYYAAKQREKDNPNDPDKVVTNDEANAFKERNVGTSANMIGINNGYSLRIQGTKQTKDDDNNDIDNAYYGPAIGVTEIKLLTMAVGEGGGYVYALNKHKEEPAASPSPSPSPMRAGESTLVTPNFLQTLGNFVFPGAKFGMPQDDGTPSLNYIIDDCYPIGRGYDVYMDPANTQYKHNVNEDQEIHYWYVNGQRYFFNATLTAYTGTPSAEKPSELFTLSSTENLLLAGITNATTGLKVKSIKWDAPNDDYDLTRDTDSTAEGVQLLSGYDLYVTVGDKPQTLITPSNVTDEDKQGTWTTQLTRTDSGEELSGAGTYDADMPLLGLALTDAVSNNAKAYYTEHLSQPAKVQVVLGAHNSDGLDYEYTLNLTIVYLKGTDVLGNIVIENCALPGERIYANAFDVKVEGDNPTITNRKWVLYKVNATYDDDGNVTSSTELPALVIPTDFRVEENSPERIAIPAYYWMNGWHLGYEMTVNGKKERVYASTATGTENQVITVHNYHRMMAWDRKTMNGSAPDIQDLQLTSGARVYIEDEKDLEQFLKYMNDVQADDCSRKGHIGDEELHAEYNTYVVVNPQFAEGIHFILLNDVEMKDEITGNKDYKFEGRLSGLGHTIDLNNCTQFMGENGTKGSIYFIGFLSKGETQVIGTNNGRVFGCFHYNTDHTGKLIGVAGSADNLQYCFQNSYSGLTDHYGYTTYYDDLDFATGKAAYDLNAFYLNERYKAATGETGNENDRFKSYVYNYYGDGEYRYANWDKANNLGTATALRRYEHPNYYILRKITAEEMDALTAVGATTTAGVGAAVYGKATTYHNCNHTHDDSRKYVTGHNDTFLSNGVTQSVWIPDYYEPNYPQDFMFWGQSIKADGDKYPTMLDTDGANRVFRASGFYGTQEDRGYYFNRSEAVMRHPRLTAVDFTGQRMRDGAIWALNKQVFPSSGAPKQTIIFPPVLDLPIDPTAVDGYVSMTSREQDCLKYVGTIVPADMHLGGMSVVGNEAITETSKVTKNLLVYIPTGKVAAAEFAQDDETAIEAHRINWDGTNFTTAQFHLVDKQDFNAPIPFNVTNRAWYERKPSHYASRSKTVADGFVIGKDAWEGVSLPFTANRVQAVNSNGLNELYNRGEITHFYGNSETRHDYWLRGLVATAKDGYTGDDVIASADFARPGVSDGETKLFDLDTDQVKAKYTYNNNWLYMTYKNEGYVEDHNAYGEELTFSDYCFLTKNAPYIVAYPGKDYYEFDLSGEFYKGKFGEENPQKIVYENKGGVTIEVTDEEASKRVTTVSADGIVTNHYGTFAHIADNNFYVLNDVTVLVGTQNIECPPGSVFVKCKEDILPFRTYLTVNSSSPQNSPSFIMIGDGTRSINSIKDNNEKQEEKYSGVNLFVRGSDLVVTSDHEFTMPLYGISGQLYRSLPVRAGKNVYHNLNSGVYMALGHKFVVRAK